VAGGQRGDQHPHGSRVTRQAGPEQRMTGSLFWPDLIGWETVNRDSRPELVIKTRLDPDPDAPLVARCLARDETAWESLVKTHTRRVYATCYHFIGRAEEAQDLTQEVFLRVFRSLKSFDAESGCFRTWLTSLTRNLLIDHYRKTRKEKLVDSIEDQLAVLEETQTLAGRPEGRVAGREAAELLRAALQKLSPELREAVILRDLQEMEYREIAEVLRVPDGTVKSRISRGRSELARVLRKLGVVL
jgi:RNA polymerase sigma-70 factor (ECF subfamily)